MRARPTCGVWPSGNGVTAVVVSGEAVVGKPVRFGKEDDACFGFISHLVALDAFALVVPEPLLAHPIVLRTRSSSLEVWVATRPLLEALRRVSGLRPTQTSALAAMLARAPAVPFFRPWMRRLNQTEPSQQLPLF